MGPKTFMSSREGMVKMGILYKASPSSLELEGSGSLAEKVWLELIKRLQGSS